MYISKDAIPAILTEYLHKVMIPKSPSSVHTFLSSVVIGMGIRKANALLTDQQTVNSLISLGVMDSVGRIDIDALQKILDDAVRISGAIHVPVIDYNIDSSDFNSIFEIAKLHSIGDSHGTSTSSDLPRSTF